MICRIIPWRAAELYTVQSWAVTPLGHHSAWSFLACRVVDPDFGATPR